MKHFGGHALNGNTSTICKCDNAEEIVGAAHRLCWNPDPSLANAWPHNAACERDIRSTKEQCRPSHSQAGFWSKLWPLSFEYTSQARTFFTAAPIHDNEKDKDSGDEKIGKTRWEVATGGAFSGTKYPLGALAYHKSKTDGLAEPTTKPGLFAGWEVESGLRYSDVVQILGDQKPSTRRKSSSL